jgi:outer membrane biosynthesis protein TonB
MPVRAGTAFSIGLHAIVVVWALWNFASVKPREAELVESLPIDLVPISELTKMKAGKIKAPEKEIAPVKQAEKKADPTPVIDPNLPVKEKEVKATPPPPPPAEEKVAKKDEPKPEETKPDPTPSPDAIQKKLEEQPKKVEKKEAPKKVVKQKAPPVKTKRDFDPDKIAELIDRRAPSRKQNAGEQKSNATLGATKGDQNMLSMDELVALARHVEKCWNVLPGVGNVERAVVELRIRMNPDGTLASAPEILNRSTSPAFQATAESAVRAVIACQPYKMLSAAKYNFWKDMIFNFAPPETVRG